MAANLTTKLGQLVDVLTPDTTNTRIGVANASPTRTLDVTGTGGFSSLLTAAGGVSSTLVTDATSATTGSIITAGGISTQKALWVGTTGNVVGNLNVGGTSNVATGVISIGVAANAAILINGRLDANTNTYGYQFVNGSAGTAATTLAVLGNGTNALQFNMFGTAWTTSGINRQGGGMVLCDGPGGLTLNTQAAQPIYFAVNSAAMGAITSTGWCVGTSINPASGAGSHNMILNVGGTTGSLTFGASNAAGTIESINGASGSLAYDSATTHVFKVNSVEKMRLDTYGDLLIGTTTSSNVGYGASIVGISRIAGSLSTNLNITTAAASASILVSMAQQFIPAIDNANNCGFSGGYRWAAVYAANGTIQTSDARQKNSITNSVLGLDFIMALRPVSYKWNIGGNTVTFDKDQNPIATPKEGKRTHFGFVAQEVKEALGEQDFGGYLETSDGSLALRYDQFIAPLTAAIQELTTRLAALENKS